jgi:PAS domain S-box-containing protein
VNGKEREDMDFEQLVATAGDGIVVADTSGAIVLWNAAAEHIFGYGAAEAMGQSLDIIIPQRLRQRHWEGYEKTMATGHTRYGAEILRVPAIRKDGSSLSIAFSVSLLHGAGGELTAIVAVIRDETARWEEERALKRRLAEFEGPHK